MNLDCDIKKSKLMWKKEQTCDDIKQKVSLIFKRWTILNILCYFLFFKKERVIIRVVSCPETKNK